MKEKVMYIYVYMCVCVCVCVYMHAWMLSCFSHGQLFVTLWTIARQASQSMGFSRQEYWSGLPCLPPADLPNPGIKPGSPALHADSLPAELPEKSCMAITHHLI